MGRTPDSGLRAQCQTRMKSDQNLEWPPLSPFADIDRAVESDVPFAHFWEVKSDLSFLSTSSRRVALSQLSASCSNCCA